MNATQRRCLVLTRAISVSRVQPSVAGSEARWELGSQLCASIKDDKSHAAVHHCRHPRRILNRAKSAALPWRWPASVRPPRLLFPAGARVVWLNIDKLVLVVCIFKCHCLNVFSCVFYICRSKHTCILFSRTKNKKRALCGRGKVVSRDGVIPEQNIAIWLNNWLKSSAAQLG